MQSLYFTEKECQCHGVNCCGGAAPMDREFLRKSDLMREEYGEPIIVSNGFRCLVHNRSVGGVHNSFHTKGLAMDGSPKKCNFITKRRKLKRLEKVAKKYFKEVVRYKTFVHWADE